MDTKREFLMNAISQFDEFLQTTELVRAAQAGDRDAFGQLFDRFQPVVMSLALRRLRDFADAQELCQDVFVQAMLKIDQLRTPEAFPGWIRQITVRMAINRSVRRSVTVAIEADAQISSDLATPLNEVLEQERSELVRDGLGRLGELDRQTLTAFYIQGQSLNEMAADFDAPLGTIKRRLHVARKRLAEEVEELASV